MSGSVGEVDNQMVSEVPLKDVSNQNASPWQVPDVRTLKLMGMSRTWRSDSAAVRKSIENF